MHPTRPAADPLTPSATPHAAPELETERLRLRQFRDSDFATYAAWCANPELMRYLGGRTFNTLEAWRHMAYMLGHWQLRGYGYYAAEEKATDRLVGRVGYTNSAGWPAFELGWTLAPGARGQGYAREAARFLLDYAFEHLERQRVVSLIHPDNAPSIRVAEHLGQMVEGETEVLTMPVLIYAVDRERWRATRSQPRR